MQKLDLKNINKLLSQIKSYAVEFEHFGEKLAVEINIKSLPFAITESLYKRVSNVQEDETLIAEWISLALVNDKGENYLTVDDVKQNFTQQLAMAIFNKILGIDELPRDDQGKSS